MTVTGYGVKPNIQQKLLKCLSPDLYTLCVESAILALNNSWTVGTRMLMSNPLSAPSKLTTTLGELGVTWGCSWHLQNNFCRLPLKIASVVCSCYPGCAQPLCRFHSTHTKRINTLINEGYPGACYNLIWLPLRPLRYHSEPLQLNVSTPVPILWILLLLAVTCAALCCLEGVSSS